MIFFHIAAKIFLKNPKFGKTVNFGIINNYHLKETKKNINIYKNGTYSHIQETLIQRVSQPDLGYMGLHMKPTKSEFMSAGFFNINFTEIDEF